MDLYPHQQRAVEFLSARKRAGLFDDMGLGKTASAICSARAVGATRVLVVAPAVVTHNWAREIRAWHPGADVQVVRTGSTNVSRTATHVVVTHDLLRRPPLMAQLDARPWNVVILDEAHAMKSPTAKRSKLFYGRLARPEVASYVWVLTGTPMPNNPTELWTMLRALAPERIGHPTKGTVMDWRAFRERFCVLAASSFTPDGVRVVGARNVDELRDRLRGFSLRRKKEDVLDLPPIRWGTVALAATQIPAELRRIEEDLPADPVAALEVLRESAQFSTWRRLCGLAKAEAAAELIDDELANRAYQKVVLFAHHAEVLDILQVSLRDYKPVRISGDVPAEARQRAVDLFQTDPATRVAVCNLVAGGVGITLTAASEVALVESSFVPGEMAQAAARCHRIGQTRPVNVRVLSLGDSFDELVAEILARKVQMIREVLRHPRERFSRFPVDTSGHGR